MSSSVALTELRRHLKRYIQRVEGGERLVVTDRDKPIAMLGPAPTTGSKLDRMIAAGLVQPPRSSTRPDPLPGDGTRSFSESLSEDRDEH